MRYRITSTAGRDLPFTPFGSLGDAERIAKSMAVGSNVPVEVWTLPDETHAAIRVSAFSPEAKPTFCLIETFSRAVARRENGEPVPAQTSADDAKPRRPKPSRVRRTVLRELVAHNDNAMGGPRVA